MKIWICKNEDGNVMAFRGIKPVLHKDNNCEGFWKVPYDCENEWDSEYVSEQGAYFYSGILASFFDKKKKTMDWKDEPEEYEITVQKVPQNKEYVDFGVASYALPKVCESLYRNGVKDAFLTQEDDSIHVRWEWRPNRYSPMKEDFIHDSTSCNKYFVKDSHLNNGQIK